MKVRGGTDQRLLDDLAFLHCNSNASSAVQMSHSQQFSGNGDTNLTPCPYSHPVLTNSSSLFYELRSWFHSCTEAESHCALLVGLLALPASPGTSLPLPLEIEH